MSDKLHISRERYQEDLARGYTVLEFRAEPVSPTKRDNFTGQMVAVPTVVKPLYRCMQCKFDSFQLDDPEGKRGMMAHLATGAHLWPYAPGLTPYGPLYRVEIDGLGESQPIAEGDSHGCTERAG